MEAIILEYGGSVLIFRPLRTKCPKPPDILSQVFGQIPGHLLMTLNSLKNYLIGLDKYKSNL